MKYLCIDRYYLVTQTHAQIAAFKQGMNNNSETFMPDKVLHKIWDNDLSPYSRGEVADLKLGLHGIVERKAGAHASNS